MVHAKRQKRSIVKDKRQEILNAAIDIFGRKGYRDANIMEVSGKAGVATGTVYLYFKNKDDLLMQSMKAMMDVTLAEIKKKVAQEKLAIDKVYMFFYHHIEVFTKRPSMARFLAVEIKQSEEFYKRYPSYHPYQEFQEFIIGLLEKAIKEGTTIPYNPRTISLLLIGAMDAVLSQWVVDPNSIDLEEVVKELREIIRFGIRIKKAK